MDGRRLPIARVWPRSRARRLWAMACDNYSGYGAYQRRAGDRLIPVFVLQPQVSRGTHRSVGGARCRSVVTLEASQCRAARQRLWGGRHAFQGVSVWGSPARAGTEPLDELLVARGSVPYSPAMPAVRDHMSSDLLSVEATVSIIEVAQRMVDRNVGAVLVLDDGRLTGILTERDVLRAVARGLRDDHARRRLHERRIRRRSGPTTRPSTRPS